MFRNINKKVGEIDKTVNNEIEDEKNGPVNGPDLNIGNQVCPVQPIIVEFAQFDLFRGNRSDNRTLSKKKSTGFVHQYTVDFSDDIILLLRQ